MLSLCLSDKRPIGPPLSCGSKMNMNILVHPTNQRDTDLVVLVPFTSQVAHASSRTRPILLSDITAPLTMPSMDVSAVGIPLYQMLPQPDTSIRLANVANTLFLVTNNNNQTTFDQTLSIIPSSILHQSPTLRQPNTALSTSTSSLSALRTFEPPNVGIDESELSLRTLMQLTQSNQSTDTLSGDRSAVASRYPIQTTDSLGVPPLSSSNNAVPPQIAVQSAIRSTSAALSAISGSSIDVNDGDGFVGPDRNQRYAFYDPMGNTNELTRIMPFVTVKSFRFDPHSNSHQNHEEHSRSESKEQPPSNSSSIPSTAPCSSALVEAKTFECSLCDKRYESEGAKITYYVVFGSLLIHWMTEPEKNIFWSSSFLPHCSLTPR